MHFKLSTKFHETLSIYFTPESLADLLVTLVDNPLAGRVIRGLNGVRKVRFPDRIRHVGTSGGLRVIYRFMPHRDLILLYLAYRKSDQTDLLPHQRDFIRNFTVSDLSLDDLWPPENNN